MKSAVSSAPWPATGDRRSRSSSAATATAPRRRRTRRRSRGRTARRARAAAARSIARQRAPRARAAIVRGRADPDRRRDHQQQHRVDHRHDPPAAGNAPPSSPAAGTSVISAGPMSLVTDAPTLPAPNMPSANPCRCRLAQAAFQAMPTENELPATPKQQRADQQACVRVVARDDQEAGDGRREQQRDHHRAGRRSDRPGCRAGRRQIDPLSTAIAASQENWILVEVQLVLDRDAEHAEHQPDREQQRERCRRQDQHALRAARVLRRLR